MEACKRRRWLVLALIAFVPNVVLAALLTPSATPVLASYAITSEKIVFNSTRTGPNQIYTMTADGKGLAQLSGSAGAALPSWSPDGTRIAFTVVGCGGLCPWVMQSDGTNPTQISSHIVWYGANVNALQWSADGQKIAFYSDQGICFAQADGSATQCVGTHGTFTWSSATNRIAVVGTVPGATNNALFTMNPDGTGVQNLLTLPCCSATINSMDWSPQGDRLAFDYYAGGAFSVYTINVDGTNQTEITPATQNFLSPQWSPDGQYILFAGSGPTPQGIYASAPDGTNRHVVVSGTPNGTRPDVSILSMFHAWSPDSRTIAFSDTPAAFAAPENIWTVNVDGTALTQLTTTGTDDLPSWQPVPVPASSFKLPYAPGQGVKWTGGPHQFANGDVQSSFAAGQGSGLDFSNGANFDVLAIANGSIVQANQTSCETAHGFGCWVAQRDDTTGVLVVCAHLLDDSNGNGIGAASVGTHLSTGQKIGSAGRSGQQAYVHLHLELRDGNAGCGGSPNCFLGYPPIDWDGLFIDGWEIHEYFVGSMHATALNYDGSATRGLYQTLPAFPYLDGGLPGTAAIPRAAVAQVDTTFACGSTPEGCTLNAEDNAASTNTKFAGSGILGAGGASSWRASQSFPYSAPPLANVGEMGELTSTNAPSSGASVGGVAELPSLSAPTETVRPFSLWAMGVAALLSLVAGFFVRRVRDSSRRG